MIQLNLLPDVKKEFLKTQRLKRNIISLSLLIVIIAVGLVVLLAIYVHGFQPFARDKLQEDIDRYTSELQQKQDINKILTVQNALNVIPELHNSTYDNSHMFEYLKVIIPNGTRLSRLNIDHDTGTMTINGRSTDYKNLNIFVDTLKNAQFEYSNSSNQTQNAKPFTDVTIDSASTARGNQSGVNFTITLDFNEEIFDTTNSGVKMTVPKITITQGFVSPEDLFEGEANMEPTE